MWKYESVTKCIKEGMSFDTILQEVELERYELLSILHTSLFDSRIKNDARLYKKIKKMYLKSVILHDINDEKIIIVSDTHIGSQLENLDYLEQIKHFVKKEDIPTLFHLGDLGDGMCSHSKEYDTFTKQVDHMIKSYMYLDNTKQYILGGNHDIKYLNKNIDILKIISDENSNIQPLGYGVAYVSLYNRLFELKHYIKNYHSFTDPIVDLTISGHSHRYKYYRKELSIPPSCDENPSNLKHFSPGFATIESHRKDESIDIRVYEYTKNGPKEKEKKLIYIK